MDENTVAGVVHRNIDALLEHRRLTEQARPLAERAARRVTRFAGTLGFLSVQVVLIVCWLAVNVGWIPGVAPLDPFPFPMLGVAASVEAIFLSTCVLITQNRQMSTEERHAELDLQINLLAEHEITHILERVDAIARKVGASASSKADHLKEQVRPEQLLEVLEEAGQSADKPS